VEIADGVGGRGTRVTVRFRPAESAPPAGG
jgi:hypothetical protein